MFDQFLQVLVSFLHRCLNVLIGQKTHGIMNALKINIRVGPDKFMPLDVDPKWSIGEVKDTLAPRVNCTPEEIRIIFAGRELDNSVVVEDCDIGQQSVIHVVKGMKASSVEAPIELRKTLVSNVLKQKLTDNDLRVSSCTTEMKKVHFFVYCTSPCKNVCHGKLRVRCNKCKLGTLIVSKDPSCWEDVLVSGRIQGVCQDENCDGTIAEFFFKCTNHSSNNEDSCVALYLIRPNLRELPCLACMEISNPVFVFECEFAHTMCLGCFQAYSISRLDERRFIQDAKIGYTLPCPIGCENSLIQETHHFRLLGDEQYSRYQRFATEEYLLQAGGVLCPQPGCGAGILPDEDCRRITCVQQGGQGCGFVFCRNCLQGYHIGECIEDFSQRNMSGLTEDTFFTEKSSWDEASKLTIKVITKPCPKCRTPTERDGGCMHMVCSRPQCGFHWCWLCQTEWSRDCMGNHWFG